MIKLESLHSNPICALMRRSLMYWIGRNSSMNKHKYMRMYIPMLSCSSRPNWISPSIYYRISYLPACWNLKWMAHSMSVDNKHRRMGMLIHCKKCHPPITMVIIRNPSYSNRCHSKLHLKSQCWRIGSRIWKGCSNLRMMNPMILIMPVRNVVLKSGGPP